MVGRYTHAHQFKRARRELKFLRIRLGRIIRDIRHKIAGNDALKERFADCSPWRCGCVFRITGSVTSRSMRWTPRGRIVSAG